MLHWGRGSVGGVLLAKDTALGEMEGYMMLHEEGMLLVGILKGG